jgi:CMP-N,N'-diacetyllegionaminic acid synthase
MIEGKTVLGIIPARGGSKGLPRKNILNIAGKPLIAWTIEEARKSKYIDRVILSSEDEEIIQVAISWGCEVPFKRPKELAEDHSRTNEVISDVLIKLSTRYDYIVLLQPTSPLRTVEDIDGCIERCVKNRNNACVTVSETEKSPHWMYYLNSSDSMQPLLNSESANLSRQDLPKVYALNGAVYVAQCQWFIENKSFLTDETLAYIMPKERSVDIDTKLDFQIGNFLLKYRN